MGGRAVYFRLSPLACASFMRSFSPSATKAAIAAVAPLVLHNNNDTVAFATVAGLNNTRTKRCSLLPCLRLLLK